MAWQILTTPLQKHWGSFNSMNHFHFLERRISDCNVACSWKWSAAKRFAAISPNPNPVWRWRKKEFTTNWAVTWYRPAEAEFRFRPGYTTETGLYRVPFRRAWFCPRRCPSDPAAERLHRPLLSLRLLPQLWFRRRFRLHRWINFRRLPRRSSRLLWKSSSSNNNPRIKKNVVSKLEVVEKRELSIKIRKLWNTVQQNEQLLSQNHPKKFLPKISLLTFSPQKSQINA